MGNYDDDVAGEPISAARSDRFPQDAQGIILEKLLQDAQ